MPLVPDPKNCDISVKRAIQGLSKKLGYTGSPTFANTTITNVITASTSVFSKTCEVAAGLNVLRVTGLQTDDTALTGTLRGAYIDVSNGSTEATGTIRALELKARTEAPDDTGSKVAVLEGLSISADSKARDVTTMRAAEFILDGKTAGTIDEAVGLRIANNLQVDKATLSYGLQIYRDSFDYTYDISLSLGGHITGDSYVNQDLRTTASPTLAGLTITGCSVLGLNSAVFQPNSDSTTFFQVLDADGGTPIFNVDTTNERVGVGTISPYSGLHYQGDIFYLTPAAGPESNDNITIKNYATGNGAPDIILRTADIAGAYGIGVGTLSLIGGSKITHYGGIGHGGGKISLQGGQGRDAANNPSYYAPVLLQPTGGNVSIGTTAPNAPLEVKGAKPGVVGDFQSGQLQVTGTGGEFYCAVITGHNSFNGNTQLWYLGSTSSSSHNDIAFINRQNAPIHFYTNNTSRMTIDAAGNVTLAIIAAEGSDVDKFLVSSSGVVKYRTGTQVLSDIGGQASDAGLSSLAGLTYAAAAFVKMTGANTFALRTLQETSDDLEATIDHDNLLNFAENEHYLQSAITQVGTIATGVWEGTSISTTYTNAKCVAVWPDTYTADQNLLIASSPTFAGLTLTGNIIVPDGGTIGQAAGPLLTFDDTNDYLEITGCKVGFGTATPTHGIHLEGSNVVAASLKIVNTQASTGSAGAGYFLYSDDGAALVSGNRFGFIVFGGSYDAAHGMGSGAAITGFADETWSATNRGSRIQFETAANGATGRTEQMRIDNSGGIFVYSLKSGVDQAAAGAAANELYRDTDNNSIKMGV